MPADFKSVVKVNDFVRELILVGVNSNGVPELQIGMVDAKPLQLNDSLGEANQPIQ